MSDLFARQFFISIHFRWCSDVLLQKVYCGNLIRFSTNASYTSYILQSKDKCCKRKPNLVLCMCILGVYAYMYSRMIRCAMTLTHTHAFPLLRIAIFHLALCECELHFLRKKKISAFTLLRIFLEHFCTCFSWKNFPDICHTRYWVSEKKGVENMIRVDKPF